LLLLFVPVFLLLQGAHWLGFLLDDLLFRGYRKIPVRDPLFVVGLPRSGTSFLQRVLAQDSDRFTTLRLWELILAPSVTERKLWLNLGRLDRFFGRPLGRLMRGGEKRGFRWLEAIHEVSLTDPEEDYFLLLPVFACFLLVIPFPYHEALWKLARFDELPVEERKPLLTFYRACLQRHLYVVGPERQLLSKNPSFSSLVLSLLETFPSARIICCVRDPWEVVPSQLSSLRPGCEIFGYDVENPSVRDRFLDMLEFYGIHLLRSLTPLPDDRHVFVPLHLLKQDVAGQLLHIYERFGWEAGTEFRERLSVESARSREYKSQHRYTLEEFGIQDEEIVTRFRELNERFGFGDPAKDGGKLPPSGRETAC
jgi:hypothetical protein